jgi:hypothetical protein
MYFLHFTQRTSSHSAGETLTLDESRNEPDIASQGFPIARHQLMIAFVFFRLMMNLHKTPSRSSRIIDF